MSRVLSASARRRSPDARETTLSCPSCKGRAIAVIRTELVGNQVGPFAGLGEINKRRRQCTECGHRWTTREIGEDCYALLVRVMKMIRSEVDE